MAIIKYKDKDGNLVPLGASGDHTHSPESIGAAKKDHGHEVATEEANGFMSSADKSAIAELHDAVFGNEKQEGLKDLVGEGTVADRIAAAIADKVVKDGSKVLSTNDYTNEEKDKLKNIDEGANKYEHPAYTERNSGLYKITIDGTGHVSDVVTVVKKDITDLGIPTEDTTYNNATQSAPGLMSVDDKKKLDGIDPGATKVTVDGTLSSSSTNPVQNKVVQSAIKDLNDLVGETPVADRIEASISKLIKALSVSGTTITYTMVDGTTGTIKTQDTDTTYNVMTGASSSVNGASGLVPQPTKGNQSKFLRADGTWQTPTDTNTHYTSSNVVTSSNTSTSNTGNVSNGSVRINSVENGSVTSSHKITGSGATTVTTDSSGNIVINSTDNNTTYSTATQYASGLMSSTDKTKLDGLSSSTYAGGTKVTLNGYDKGASTASFYAPTTYGTSGQFLKSNGNNTPTWVDAPTASYDVFSISSNGLVPKPSSNTTYLYLNASGSWSAPQALQTSANIEDKRFLVGVQTQGGMSGVASHSNCYMQDGHLYSNGKRVGTAIIDAGTSATTTVTGGGSPKTYEIIFTQQFSSSPVVTLTLAMPGDQQVETIGLSVGSTTTSGCLVKISNTGGNDKDVIFNWIAVGL